MPLIRDIRRVGAIAKSYLGDIESCKYQYQGHSCSYLKSGQGEPMILLHGSAVTKSYWRQIMQHLAPYHQVIALEVPGYNVERPTYHGRFTFKHLSDWLRETLKAIGLPDHERIHLVGYCSGAALAAYFAASFPERVRSLTMISIPYIYIDSQMSVDARKSILESRWVENEQEFYALLKKTFAHPPYVPAIAVRRYLKNMKGKHRLFEKVVEDTCRSAVLLVSRFRNITMPVLAMTGDRDSLSPVTAQEALVSALPHLQQAVIGSCSHLSIIEQPDAIAERILGFVGKPVR